MSATRADTVSRDKENGGEKGLMEGAKMKTGPKLPKRSKRHGVGKKIGGAVYVHRQYEGVLGQRVLEAKAHLPEGFEYTVVKLSERTGIVSFIVSRDFDTNPEPTVCDSISVTPDGTICRRMQRPDPWIYHHKWLFVADDYRGFDVEESKRRSLAWMSLEDVDRHRIGRRSYWAHHVLKRLDRDRQS
jgi:hypothetical protein